MSDDDQITEAFQALRSAERAKTPPFGRVVAGRPRTRKRRLRLVSGVLAAGAAAVIVGLGLRLRGSDTTRTMELARQVMAWRSRTDFLLPAEPGLLSSIPRIGGAPDGSPLQTLDPGSPLGPPALPRSPRS